MAKNPQQIPLGAHVFFSLLAIAGLGMLLGAVPTGSAAIAGVGATLLVSSVLGRILTEIRIEIAALRRDLTNPAAHRKP